MTGFKRAGWGVAVSLVGAVAVGCSQAGFGESANLPQDKHASLVANFSQGQPLSLPSDTGFNLHDTQRHASGKGKAISSADPAGRASCQADADGVGAATAEFQLGYVLDNRGTDPLDVTADLKVSYSCEVQGNPDEPAKEPDHLGLRVFVRDSNHRILRSMVLTEVTPFNGPRRWSSQQNPTFDFTMEPGLAYYIVLAGRTAVTGTESNSASARVDVQSTALDLYPRN
ncbi:MAG: hypothetical protein ACE5GE_02655 [Phycisphaerae bacterium]